MKEIMKYAVCCKENGDAIDEFATREEAAKALAKYEEFDKQEGIYEEDFYEVSELEVE